MEILLSHHRLLDQSEFLSRRAKYLHKQNYVVVKNISGVAVAHKNKKDGFARGGPRTRTNSYFRPTAPVLAAVRGHACSMVEHLMRLIKTQHDVFKHCSW